MLARSDPRVASAIRNRNKVAARVASRVLPAQPPQSGRALSGSGQLCEICDERLFPSAIEITCELPFRPTVRLHVDCYRAWVAYALRPAEPPAPAGSPRTVYLHGPVSDLNLLDRYIATATGRLPFDVEAVRHALRHCPASTDSLNGLVDAPMSLPLPAPLADRLKAWLDKDAQRLAEAGHDTMSAMLRRLSLERQRGPRPALTPTPSSAAKADE